MTAGIIFVVLQTYLQIRFKYRNMDDLRFTEPRCTQQLRDELAVWQGAAASLSLYSKDEILVRETLEKKVDYLERQLKRRLATGKLPRETYETTLKDLQSKVKFRKILVCVELDPSLLNSLQYFIRNKKLLIKSAVALAFTIIFFFLHAVPHIQRLSIGWTALVGAMLLLILADREDIESVVAHVEWATLLFFAGLFVLTEALTELGLIGWIGTQTENVILACPEETRLAVAILIILWVKFIQNYSRHQFKFKE